MQKNIEQLQNILKDLKKGVLAYSTQWAALTVSEAVLGTAIADLHDAIDTADIALKKARLAAKASIKQCIPLKEQTIGLAEGLHKSEQEKPTDYNLSITTGRITKSIPSKAAIKSLVDDYDGIGFILKIQPLTDAEGFETEKSNLVKTTTLVLPPPYHHLRNNTKPKYINDDIIKGKRYFYRVRGHYRRGYGEWCKPVSRGSSNCHSDEGRIYLAFYHCTSRSTSAITYY